MSIVSNNIKYLRRLNGLTQEQFARKIGIKRSLVGAYEEARANPNLDNLKNMAFVFGVTVDNLVKNDMRKLRETPDLSLPFETSALPAQHDGEEVQGPVEPPKPFAAIMERFHQGTPSEQFASPAHDPIDDFDMESPVRPASGDELLGAMMKPVDTGFQRSAVQRERPGSIRLVRSKDVATYLHQYQQERFLDTLPVIQLPGLPDGYYRAFEAGKDFMYPNAILVGALISNLYEIQDNTQYVVILKSRGLVFRRAFNQLRTKGVLLLSSDLQHTPPIEVATRDLIEVWEVRAVINYQIPEPPLNFGRIQQLVDALQQELRQT